MRRVISASRRTDIPAFYSEWMINRLRDGECYFSNPFNSRVYRISLRPEDCFAIVFWTRNPNPLEKYLDEIIAMGHRFYFQFSILGYPKQIESHNPSIQQAITVFKEISKRISPQNVIWRYDPILISSISSPEYHISQFTKIATQLESYTNHVVFSFVDFYGKTLKNLKRSAALQGFSFDQPNLEEKLKLSLELQDVAKNFGMNMNSCCDDSLAIEGIKKNHCVDINLIRSIEGDSSLIMKSEPTRKDCGCVSSVDIGVYDTCLFGCNYCYATHSRENALKKYSKHDPNDSILFRPQKLTNVDLSKVALELKSK